MLLRVNIENAGYDLSGTIWNIQFELQQGQLLAIIGPNGSGKTTLIRAISQVLPNINGQFHINGTDLANVNEADRARMMAVVPQSTYVPPSFIVQEVVMMGRTPYMNWLGRASHKDKAVVEKVMAQTDITGFRDRLCGELSAGERQRVILARALAQQTPLLLMDEPTAHLDLRYQIEFLKMVKKLSNDENKTVLIAMHNLNLAARFGDFALAMKEGKAAAYGQLNKIMRPQMLSDIYGLPIEVHYFNSKRSPFITPA
ncbi:MAG: ABC transporter ATP-binding protein [Anaerolineaceae bacterium]|nr:ABC transporter ATP-binding protein [Anaerolineaceae bacterium]